MKKISQILKETNVNQIYGDLIRFNEDELEGKCALGVLACESGKENLKLSKHTHYVLSEDILNAYEIADLKYPYLNVNGNFEWDFESEVWLSTLIIRLNDTYHFTFKEIGEFLEVTFDL